MKLVQTEENINSILDLTTTNDHFSGNLVETLASDLLKMRRAVETLLQARHDNDVEMEEDIISRLRLMISFE